MTSQIFANVYLNEFDRFVRHNVKPLGYVRYGDDFILIMNSREETVRAQEISKVWLAQTLKLQIHSRNNVVIKARHGLKFLGHNIHPNSPLSVDNVMSTKLKRDINAQNAASYRSMHLTTRQTKQLPWILLKSINDDKVPISTV